MLQAFAAVHDKMFARSDLTCRRRQLGDRRTTRRADRCERLRNGQAPPVAHHAGKKRGCSPGNGFIVERDHVPDDASVQLNAIHLLPPRICLFVGAQLHDRCRRPMSLHLDQLVDAPERGRIRGGGQRRADTEAIDGSAILDEPLNAMLVHVAADEDLGPSEASRVQEAAYLAAEVSMSPLSSRTAGG